MLHHSHLWLPNSLTACGRPHENVRPDKGDTIKTRDCRHRGVRTCDAQTTTNPWISPCTAAVYPDGVIEMICSCINLETSYLTDLKEVNERTLDGNDNECCFCQDGGPLYLCASAGCTKATHFRCAQANGSPVKDKVWYCNMHAP